MATKKANSKVPTAQPNARAEFVTWDNDKERVDVLRNVAVDNLNAYGVVQKSTADFRGYRNFKDIDSNLSVTPGFTRGDLEFFRPEVALPKNQKEAIMKCMVMYERVGLVKNVIDAMSDFATRGVRLVHSDPKIEEFYQKWFAQVGGPERSERFVNYLYRAGNTAVKRTMAKVSLPGRKNLTLPSAKGSRKNAWKTHEFKAKAADGIGPASFRVTVEPTKPLADDEIPWRYTFLNCLGLDTIAEELAQFVGKPIYALVVPLLLRNRVMYPRNELEAGLVQQIPKDITNAAKAGSDRIVIDQNSLSVYHYKKDDWLVWGYPLIYAILDDLMLYQTLKLSDLAACQNMMSSVRLWRMGDLANKIFPTKAGIQKLADMLTNNTGGGAFDLIWGPELDFKESNSTVYKFLGNEKYGPTLTAIYGGLGIPTALTGSPGSTGMSANYVSLKTLTERLEYARTILCQFWNQEIEIVRRVMGFKEPAQVTFDRMILSDETAEKQLLISLIDRDIISAETVLDRFDEIPQVEKNRLRREQKLREKGLLPEKAGPFHKTQISEQLKQGFVNQGMLTPSQVGLDLPPKKPGEKTLRESIIQERKNSQKRQPAEPKGEPGEGRPLNKKDSTKRKTKQVKPSVRAMWAKAALDKIAEITTPAILKHYKKTNLRRLTASQASEFEEVKFGILCNLPPMQDFDEESIASVIDKGAAVPPVLQSYFLETVKAFTTEFKREPTLEESRQIQILSYTNYLESSDG